jgi:isopentenyl diphosphate isomerase/L-lactate dehydrogenase-like FMN-dependent dehydrogenase
VGDRIDVLFDSGIRRGMDVVKAMALGAKGCLIGRALLYGLAARGQPGVAQVIDILKQEIDSAIAHVGIADVRELAKRRAEFLFAA